MQTSRKRYEGLVWLRSLVGDPADGRITSSQLPRMGVSSSVSALTERWRLLVECEQVNGSYVVRCIPRRGSQVANGVPIAAGYTGSNLQNILHCAFSDYRRLEEKPWDAELSKREVLRFVVP